MAEYTKVGNYEVIPVADAQNLVSNANRQDDERKTYKAAGKRPGKKVLIDLDGTEYALCIALGSKSSDAYARCDGGANYTPVNLNPAAGGFTIGGDSTYAANLLTTDGGNDAAGRAFQTVALKAGTYRLDYTIASEGASGDYVTGRIRIKSGSVTAGVGATDVVSAIVGDNVHRHATAAESADPKLTGTVKFTLATDLSVTFTLDVVDEATALAAGSAYIALNKLEGINA